MAAYLKTLITGNENFGGYLSVDGEKAFSVKHDMTYELDPGAHTLVVYTTSNFERGAGKVQAFTYAHTSSSGAIADTIEANSAIKNLGDAWEIDVLVEEGDLLELNIYSKGSKLTAAPRYSVTALTPEEKTALENQFEEWRNTPVRSPKQITIGVILAIVGVIGGSDFVMSFGKESTLSVFLGSLGILAVGALLIYLGSKKKLRRK